MSDLKSKLPDFKEITSIASKLFKDVKTSVCEIIDEYKKKREDEEPKQKKSDVTSSSDKVTEAKTKPAAKKSSPATEKSPREKKNENGSDH